MILLTLMAGAHSGLAGGPARLTSQTKTAPFAEPAAACDSSDDRQAVHQVVDTLKPGAVSVCCTWKVRESTTRRQLSLPQVSTSPAQQKPPHTGPLKCRAGIGTAALPQQ